MSDNVAAFSIVIIHELLSTLRNKFPPTGKSKGLPQQAEVAQGIQGKLRPRIFLTFGTTRVVGRQPLAPAAFTQGEVTGIHF
jgi:hypothetical protein